MSLVILRLSGNNLLANMNEENNHSKMWDEFVILILKLKVEVIIIIIIDCKIVLTMALFH